MTRITRAAPSRLNAGQIVCEMARRFNWQINRMMTEFDVDGGRADLVFLTKSGYLTEIEIKVSLSDLRADALKAKWRKPRPHIARLYFAVPAELVERALPLLPDGAGLISVSAGERGLHSREVRSAKRRGALKITDAQRAAFHEAAYFRFWRWRMHELPRLTANVEHWRKRAREAETRKAA